MHGERREDFPLQDSPVALWGTWIWGHRGQGVPILNMEYLNSAPGRLKTIPASVSQLLASPRGSIWGVLAVQAPAAQTSACFCPQLTCHVRQGQGDCSGQLLLSRWMWGKENREEDPCSGRGCSTVSSAGCPWDPSPWHQCLVQVRTLQNPGHLYKFQIDAAAEM